MVAFYVRNGKLKKLASLQKKQQSNNKTEEAAFSGLFLEADAFSSPLLAAHAPLYHTAIGAPPSAPLKAKCGALPEVTLLPPGQDVF